METIIDSIIETGVTFISFSFLELNLISYIKIESGDHFLQIIILDKIYVETVSIIFQLIILIYTVWADQRSFLFFYSPQIWPLSQVLTKNKKRIFSSNI